MLCVQLHQQLHSWQDTPTYAADFQLMHGFHCIPQRKGQIPNLGFGKKYVLILEIPAKVDKN